MLDELVGQEKVKKFLKEVIRKKKTGAYLFIGPEGVGKRTAALLFASEINQNRRDILQLTNPDVKLFFPKRKDKPYEELVHYYKYGEVAPSPVAGEEIHIDTIRQIKEEMLFPPRTLKYRVYIILYVDRMRIESANAFLKTLEEPEKNTIFILTTSRPFFVLSTIKSRCQVVKFNLISEDVMREFLLRKGFAPQMVEKAVYLSGGSMKEAFNYIKNPDDYLSKAAVAVFAETPVPDYLVIDYANLLQENLDKFIKTLQYLYNMTLKFKKTGREPPLFTEIIKKKAEKVYEEMLIQDILLLEEYRNRLSYNPNKRLFIASLLHKLH